MSNLKLIRAFNPLRPQISVLSTFLRNITVIVLFILCCHLSYAKEIRLRVKYVIDGDTIVLSNDRHIRYIGINTPEVERKGKHPQKGEPNGKEAKVYNKKIVLGKTVRLELDQKKEDQYGRSLAYVFLENNRFVNLEMLEKGYAFFIQGKKNKKYSAELLKAQQRAMMKKTGMWKGWRIKTRTYIGNVNSKRFHERECQFGKRINKKKIKVFTNQWDAFWNGYAPCKKCLGNKARY